MWFWQTEEAAEVEITSSSDTETRLGFFQHFFRAPGSIPAVYI